MAAPRRAPGRDPSHAGPGRADQPSAGDIARAARVLRLRTRREATSALGGAWRSAFRGSGTEFEELRPYLPGDDVRTLDWNAVARTGVPFVRRRREERDQTLLLLLDVSASMRFGMPGRSKAALAAHLAALLAATAARAGDRVGLVTFDAGVRDVLAPDRGAVHAFRVMRRAIAAAGRAGGSTGLATALARVPQLVRRPAIVCLVSDFREGAPGPGSDRDPALQREAPRDGALREARRDGTLRGALAATATRHDLVSIVLHDPREDELPPAGRVRLADPEDPRRTLVADASDPGLRARYRAAAAARRRGLERTLHTVGGDAVWIRTSEDPLRALTRFFRARTKRRELAR